MWKQTSSSGQSTKWVTERAVTSLASGHIVGEQTFHVDTDTHIKSKSSPLEKIKGFKIRRNGQWLLVELTFQLILAGWVTLTGEGKLQEGHSVSKIPKWRDCLENSELLINVQRTLETLRLDSWAGGAELNQWFGSSIQEQQEAIGRKSSNMESHESVTFLFCVCLYVVCTF